MRRRIPMAKAALWRRRPRDLYVGRMGDSWNDPAEAEEKWYPMDEQPCGNAIVGVVVLFTIALIPVVGAILWVVL